MVSIEVMMEVLCWLWCQYCIGPRSVFMVMLVVILMKSYSYGCVNMRCKAFQMMQGAGTDRSLKYKDGGTVSLKLAYVEFHKFNINKRKFGSSTTQIQGTVSNWILFLNDDELNKMHFSYYCLAMHSDDGQQLILA